MCQALTFLDEHNGAVMVIITAIYVLATIGILFANLRSAKATREQLIESKRQYEEEHRPYIAYQIIFENRTWYGMRFTNCGRQIANHVQIKFDEDFLASLTNTPYVKDIYQLKDKELILGIGQSYDVFFGQDGFRENPYLKPITGEIIYGEQNKYRETFYIDFARYATFYSVTNSADIFHKDMEKIIGELKAIEQKLKKQ